MIGLALLVLVLASICGGVFVYLQDKGATPVPVEKLQSLPYDVRVILQRMPNDQIVTYKALKNAEELAQKNKDRLKKEQMIADQQKTLRNSD